MKCPNKVLLLPISMGQPTVRSDRQGIFEAWAYFARLKCSATVGSSPRPAKQVKEY